MQRARSRQSPSSCESCRARKLKCDRVQPCSNCTAREKDCVFVVPPHKRQRSSVTSADRSNAELWERIERLEALVAAGRPSERLQDTAPSVPDAGGLLARHQQQESPQVQSQVLRGLDDAGTGDYPLLRSFIPEDTPRFTTRSPRAILALPQSTTSKPSIVLPSHTAAVALLDNYVAHVNHVCRVLHVPTVRSLVHVLYVRLARGDTHLPLDQAALCLSLFALSAFFYPPSENSAVAATERDAVGLSVMWTNAALDVLDHSSRTASGTLMDIQAMILLIFATFHLDGFSARARLLHARAIGLARDLRLHRIDAEPQHASVPQPRCQLELEVKRRVFWHLAASDWLNAAISGPQEGTYFIHPSQISVRLPEACSDDEIVFGQCERAGLLNDDDGDAHPDHASMEFFLARVRLAQLCREIADTAPLLETGMLLQQLPYERVLALDQKLQDFLSSALPVSLRADPESRAKSRPLEAVWPHLSTMRWHITAATHARRCRLHQKLLLRQTADRRFVYSRRAALESARALLRLYQDQQQQRRRRRQRREQSRGEEHESYDVVRPPSMDVARMGIVVHYTHLALVVLVMDLCFNKTAEDHAEVKRDVAAAMQQLEGVRHVSPLVCRSLNALQAVLEKHHVDVNVPVGDRAPPAASPANNPHFEGMPLPLETTSDQHRDLLHPGPGADAWPDAFWESVFPQNENGADSPDPAAWEDLFLSLDTRPF